MTPFPGASPADWRFPRGCPNSADLWRVSHVAVRARPGLASSRSSSGAARRRWGDEPRAPRPASVPLHIKDTSFQRTAASLSNVDFSSSFGEKQGSCHWTSSDASRSRASLGRSEVCAAVVRGPHWGMIGAEGSRSPPRGSPEWSDKED